MELVLDSFESFVGVNFWTMIFAWINILILYIVLRKLLFKPVKNMIDSRQREIDDMYSDAQSSLDSAKQMEAEYKEKLNDAKAESEEILRSAVRRAELREEEILKEANAKARRTLERADEQVELEKKRAINEVKNEVSDVALAIARAVIERDISEKDHNAIVDEFIDKMGD